MIISSATAISPQQVHQVATPFTVIIIALIQGEEKEEEHNIDNIIRVQNFIAIELKHFRHQEHLLNIFFCLALLCSPSIHITQQDTVAQAGHGQGEGLEAVVVILCVSDLWQDYNVYNIDTYYLLLLLLYGGDAWPPTQQLLCMLLQT